MLCVCGIQKYLYGKLAASMEISLIFKLSFRPKGLQVLFELLLLLLFVLISLLNCH